MRGTTKTLVIDGSNVDQYISHAAITGRLIPNEPEDYMRLARLMRAYRDAVRAMLNKVWRGVSHTESAKSFYDKLPNYVYLETAYKQARLITEGIRYWELVVGEERILAGIGRLWLASRGNRWDRGNRNVKLLPGDRWFDVLVKYPYSGRGLGLRRSSAPSISRFSESSLSWLMRALRDMEPLSRYSSTYRHRYDYTLNISLSRNPGATVSSLA